MAYEPLTLLLRGEIEDAVLTVFTGIFPPGFENIFYAIVLMVAFGVVYIKTENFGTVGVLGLLISGIVLSYLPIEFHMLAFAIIFISFLAILYDLYKSR